MNAILGDKTAITGGTGKVVNSGPNDRIFIYYADHGGPGILSKYIFTNQLLISHIIFYLFMWLFYIII